METPRHREQMERLIHSLQVHWADRRDYYVGGNMFVHYDPQNPGRFRGPDFFLVLDVEDRERKSWVVWWEGMRFPDLIIELLSESTRHIDKGEKKSLYERLFHTGEYYLYDPFSQEFEGYHLQGAHYEKVEPDEERKIYSPLTDLYLAVRGDWLRWMTREGDIIPIPKELAEQEQLRAEQERERAEQERERADQEQLRAEQERERAEQERERAEQERERAEQERERAEQERERAEQERERADQAEQLLEAYRRRFGSLG